MENLDQLDLSVMTPMMQQYYTLKKTRQDAILFFRMGDFYEIFGSDACEVAPKLGIVLTSRERGDKNKIGFCGVPHHSAKSYWMKLLAMNYKVAIADQVEAASEAKGLVKREIIKVLTPACVDELEGLELGESNYLLGAYEDPRSKSWSSVLCDVSTGEFRLGKIESPEQIFQMLESYKPKELLLRRFHHKKFSSFLDNSEKFSSVLLGELDEELLNDEEKQKKIFSSAFGDGSFSEHAKKAGSVQLVSCILSYLESLHLKTKHFRSVRPLFESNTKTLEATAVRDLELLETTRGQRKKGSLFHSINQTMTPMGSRLLRRSLVNVFVKKAPILERQKKVEAFFNLGQETILSFRASLSGFGDLERLATRIASFSIRPYELAKVKESLLKVEDLHQKLSSYDGVFPFFSKGLISYKEPLSLLEEALSETASNLGSDFKVFKPGYDSQLDELLSLMVSGEEKIENYQASLREKTGISNLKIKAHKTYGLLVEVSKANLKKVPEFFIRRQTMVNCDRFVTEDLKDLDETLSSAREKAVLREGELFEKLLSLLQKQYDELHFLASALGELDLALAFSWFALKNSYSKPSFSENSKLALVKARHPVIEDFVGASNFVANDISMEENSRVLLITGPNMAGKSTVMRQTALCAILAQIGSYVPCERAELPLFDNIYTRVGASDDLSQGLSTFMVEMKEASLILRHASEKSLVILDEVGRGTSTEDGLALAHGILDFIAKKVGAWTLFATHYHELVEPAKAYPNVKLVHTKVLQKKESIEFTHELIEGSSGHSYGLEVAKLAGVPEDVLEFAQNLISKKVDQAPKLLVCEEVPSSQGEGRSPKGSLPRDLKTEEILSRLQKVSINRTTPMQALNILNDLVVILQTSPSQSLFHDGQSFF